MAILTLFLTRSEKSMRSEYSAIRKKYEKLATVKDVVDHIDHVVQVIGIDYVGIGTDFDGGGGVDGCKTVAEMKNITIELLRRGYSKADITKIWGGNVMRVLKKVETVQVTRQQEPEIRQLLFNFLPLRISVFLPSSLAVIFLDLFSSDRDTIRFFSESELYVFQQIQSEFRQDLQYMRNDLQLHPYRNCFLHDFSCCLP